MKNKKKEILIVLSIILIINLVVFGMNILNLF